MVRWAGCVGGSHAQTWMRYKTERSISTSSRFALAAKARSGSAPLPPPPDTENVVKEQGYPWRQGTLAAVFETVPEANAPSIESPKISSSRVSRRPSAPRPTTFLEGEAAEQARIVSFQKCRNDKVVKHRFGSISASSVRMRPVRPLRPMQVAKLSHGLDKVLFSPGIHWLQDSETGKFNYEPHLRDVLDVDLFDYSALPPYVTSSKDAELLEITRRHQKKYCGSTSSLTGLLSQCYYLVSRWKEPELQGFGRSFRDLPTGFSEAVKLPVSVTLQRQRGGFYAIDANKNSDGEEDNSNYVLTSLGKSLEKFLTTPPASYTKYERVNSHKLSKKEKEQLEAYHYAKSSRFLLRSQLDCQDDRLPRKTFDLKTRAVVSIRQDRANYAEGCGYQIRTMRGAWESFEREYWDMVRSAFLKYNFQVRIGHMDGIFVAYHNTAQIFGFQYVSLEEMNLRLFGSNEMGDMAFNLSLGLLEKILDAATEALPNETLTLTLETRPGSNNMTVIAEAPATSKIAQLDVQLDRYLQNTLVEGPVDLRLYREHLSAKGSDAENIVPEWRIDYCITPRTTMPEAQARANLSAIRQRQVVLRSMPLPNVELLNERETYRIKELAKRPAALVQFLRDREDGTAMGMPLAPGQLTTRELIRTHAQHIRLPSPPRGKVPTPSSVKWQKFQDRMTSMLRKLSREGAKEQADEPKRQ